MREFLEKHYTEEAIETDDLTIKLVIKALLEVSTKASLLLISSSMLLASHFFLYWALLVV